MSRKQGKKTLVWGITVAIAVGAIALAACAPRTNTGVPVPNPQAPASTPAADEFGVITAASWAEQYPLQYNSYLENAKNVPGAVGEYAEITAKEPDVTSAGEIKATAESGKADYLDADQYPEIKTLGKGYGYAKYYTEPGGHTYSIWSIEHNGRLGDVRGGNTKGKLSCYACKTPQIHFEAAKEDDGSGTYWTQSAVEGVDHFVENISCANCHVNDNPTELNIIRADWKRAMGDDTNTVPMQGQVCGQCHCDYSMAPTGEGAKAPFNDGEPTSPYYGGIASMTPEKALEFYDEYNFSDWTYTSTGAKMLAVRHAEFEFCYAMGGYSHMTVNLGYNCNDCHMPVMTAEDGTAYSSHYWESPLENEELIKNNCSSCHADLKAEVQALQKDIDGRTHLLGLRAEKFIKNFESKVATDAPNADGEMVPTFNMDTAKANGLTEDQVAQLQKIQRYACYYWNLAAAENSEGAHNPQLYNELLDKGNAQLDEADKILGMSSVVEA